MSFSQTCIYHITKQSRLVGPGKEKRLLLVQWGKVQKQSRTWNRACVCYNCSQNKAANSPASASDRHNGDSILLAHSETKPDSYPAWGLHWLHFKTRRYSENSAIHLGQPTNFPGSWNLIFCPSSWTIIATGGPGSWLSLAGLCHSSLHLRV